jgi:hypothetical protein
MSTASLAMVKLADLRNQDITSEVMKELACSNKVDAGLLEVKKPSKGFLDWIRGGGINARSAAKNVSKQAGELGMDVKMESDAVKDDQAVMTLEEADAINKKDVFSKTEEAVKVVLDKKTGRGGLLETFGEVNRKEAFVTVVVKPEEEEEQDVQALEEPLDLSSKRLDTSMMTSKPARGICQG